MADDQRPVSRRERRETVGGTPGDGDDGVEVMGGGASQFPELGGITKGFAYTEALPTLGNPALGKPGLAPQPGLPAVTQPGLPAVTPPGLGAVTQPGAPFAVAQQPLPKPPVDETGTDAAGGLSRRDRRRLERLEQPMETWTADEEARHTGQVPTVTPEVIAQQEALARQRAAEAQQDALRATGEIPIVQPGQVAAPRPPIPPAPPGGVPAELQHLFPPGAPPPPPGPAATPAAEEMARLAREALASVERTTNGSYADAPPMQVNPGTQGFEIPPLAEQPRPAQGAPQEFPPRMPGQPMPPQQFQQGQQPMPGQPMPGQPMPLQQGQQPVPPAQGAFAPPQQFAPPGPGVPGAVPSFGEVLGAGQGQVPSKPPTVPVSQVTQAFQPGATYQGPPVPGPGGPGVPGQIVVPPGGPAGVPGGFQPGPPTGAMMAMTATGQMRPVNPMTGTIPRPIIEVHPAGGLKHFGWAQISILAAVAFALGIIVWNVAASGN